MQLVGAMAGIIREEEGVDMKVAGAGEAGVDMGVAEGVVGVAGVAGGVVAGVGAGGDDTSLSHHVDGCYGLLYDCHWCWGHCHTGCLGDIDRPCSYHKLRTNPIGWCM